MKKMALLILLTLGWSLGAQETPWKFKRILDTPYPKHSGTAGGDLVVADLNGDGLKDILVTGQQHTSFITWIYYQTTAKTFSPPEKTAHGLPGLDKGVVMRAADMDGDADLDLVFYGRTGVAMQTALFQVWLNDGLGKFTLGDNLGIQLPSEDFADVPGAWGKAGTAPDNQSDTEVKGLYNGQGWSTGVLEVGDFNRDGKPDILFAGAKGMEAGTDPAGQMIQRDWETSGVFLGQGGGKFTYLTASGYPQAGVPADSEKFPERSYPGLPKVNRGSSALGDFNGDGVLDVAVLGQGNTGSKANAGIPESQRNGLPLAEVLLGKGDGTFTPSGSAGLPALIDGAVRPADINQDGKMDLLVMGNTGKTSDPAGGRVTGIYLGQGDGTFRLDTAQGYEKTPGSPDWIVPMMTGDLAAVDLDGDGDEDLAALGNANDRALYLYRNTGGKMSQVALDKMKNGLGSNNLQGNASPDAVTEGDLWAGDLDGDGDADLVVNGRGGSFQLLVFQNQVKP